MTLLTAYPPTNLRLKDLNIGDKFYPKSKQWKATPIFEVLEQCKFNSGHGSSTRMCRTLLTKEVISKSCRLEVIKIN